MLQTLRHRVNEFDARPKCATNARGSATAGYLPLRQRLSSAGGKSPRRATCTTQRSPRAGTAHLLFTDVSAVAELVTMRDT